MCKVIPLRCIIYFYYSYCNVGLHEGEIMKKFFSKVRARQFWTQVYASHRCKMSRGAQNIARMINFANKDNWRRKQK